MGALCEQYHLFCSVTFLKIKIPSHTLQSTPPPKHSLKQQKNRHPGHFSGSRMACSNEQVMGLQSC